MGGQQRLLFSEKGRITIIAILDVAGIVDVSVGCKEIA